MTDKADNEPLVSAFVGTYDREDVLPRALRSILEQSYSNMEVIVVDDHSPESQRHVVESITSEYDTDVTFVRHNQNRGWGAAINTAYANANGDLFALIGDDDEWSDRDKIKKQVAALQNSHRDDIGVVCTGWRTISAESGEVKDVTIPHRPQNLERHILGQNQIIQSIGAVVTREAWEDVGGADESVPRGIDSDLFRRIILEGYDVFFVEEPLIDIYVGRADRMTAKQNPEDIWPHIESERLKLRKFPSAFEKYPESRARVLEKIGTHFIRIYRDTRDPEHLKQGREHFRESISYNPRHWKAFVRYVWSVGAQLEAVVKQ